MIYRLTVALLLGGLAAIASGCAPTSNGETLPPGASAAGSQTPEGRFGPDRIRIREFADLPQYGSNYYSPSGVVRGPDGDVWVTDTIDQDFGENVVVAIASSGADEHAYYYGGVGSQGASFQDICVGPDGNFWITDEYNEQVVRMTPQGVYTGFPLKNYTAPFNITSGPGSALWFTMDSATKGPAIGRITTTGSVKVYSVAALPLDIAAGPDGALWFTQPSNDEIGRLTPRGKVTEYSKGITSGSQPYSIAAGPDGALWFTERTGGRIGRITTAGRVTEYSNGITPTEMPFDLTAGPDGAMWFTEYESYGSYHVRNSKIGRITMQGAITEHSKGVDSAAGPTAISVGPDRRIWFAESSTDKMGRINL